MQTMLQLENDLALSMRLMQLQSTACLLYVICWHFLWLHLVSTAAHEMLGGAMLEAIQASAGPH